MSRRATKSGCKYAGLIMIGFRKYEAGGPVWWVWWGGGCPVQTTQCFWLQNVYAISSSVWYMLLELDCDLAVLQEDSEAKTFVASNVPLYTVYTMYRVYFMYSVYSMYKEYTMYKINTMYKVYSMHKVYTM
jgi:hypothetical protein